MSKLSLAIPDPPDLRAPAPYIDPCEPRGSWFMEITCTKSEQLTFVLRYVLPIIIFAIVILVIAFLIARYYKKQNLGKKIPTLIIVGFCISIAVIIYFYFFYLSVAL